MTARRPSLSCRSILLFLMLCVSLVSQPVPSAAQTPATQPAHNPDELLAKILSNPRSGDVEKLQRQRVEAYMAMDQYEQALVEAKSYYNVVSLGNTRDAVELLAEVLNKTHGQIVAEEFRVRQTLLPQQSSPAEDEVPEQASLSPLDTIQVSPVPYDLALSKRPRPRNVNDLLARGNVLLLADQPAEAKKCFEEVCNLAAKDGKHIGWTRDAVAGIARAIRAERGHAAEADQMVMALRRQTLDSPGPSKVHDLRAAAFYILPASITSNPSLELERQGSNASEGNRSRVPEIRFVAEESTPANVEVISSNHLSIELVTKVPNWFMFRLTGVSGRIVRIDLKGGSLSKWWSLNPVYGTVKALDDPGGFLYSRTAHDREYDPSWNGPLIPVTGIEESWHFIPNVWISSPDTLSFVQKYETDDVWIAMRVPFTPGYGEQYAKQIRTNPNVRVHVLGKSRQGRPLRIFEVGDSDPKLTPCVFVYAREHGNEQDSSWVAQGLLDFIAGDTAEARQLRRSCTFLVAPLLDPDGAAAGVYSNITDGFSPLSQTSESRAYASFFRVWIDAGHRLDMAINLHNLESGDGPHVYCALVEPSNERGDLSILVHSRVTRSLQSAGFDADMPVRMRSFFSRRLGGWLLGYYGSLHLLYEVNSQSPTKHLLPDELRRMGRVIAETVGDELSSDSGQRILTVVDAQRAVRKAAVDEASDVNYDQSPIRYEYEIRSRVPSARQNLVDPELLTP